MPHDVSTRWNSTYDMLAFAIKYRAAIDSMTAARDLGLRDYELDSVEWTMAGEVEEVLKVRQFFISSSMLTQFNLSRFLRTLLSFSLAELQTWPPSSQRWTTLTRFLRPRLIALLNFSLPFEQLLRLARELWTVTMTKRTNLRCTGLPWVSQHFIEM